MSWWWYPLIALAAVIAFYGIATAVVLLIGRHGLPVEMPGGETILLPPEPPP